MECDLEKQTRQSLKKMVAVCMEYYEDLNAPELRTLLRSAEFGFETESARLVQLSKG
jgi:hypothetical protein